MYVYPDRPSNNETTTSGEEAVTKSSSALFVFRDVNLSAEKWREVDGKKRRKRLKNSKPLGASATHLPLNRCRSSLIFNSLILDCIIWGVIKISHCFQPRATKSQSRGRGADALIGFLSFWAQTSRYRADYALLAVHGDLIVRSKLTTVFHRCEAEQISLGWEISVQ